MLYCCCRCSVFLVLAKLATVSLFVGLSVREVMQFPGSLVRETVQAACVDLLLLVYPEGLPIDKTSARVGDGVGAGAIAGILTPEIVDTLTLRTTEATSAAARMLADKAVAADWMESHQIGEFLAPLLALWRQVSLTTLLSHLPYLIGCMIVGASLVTMCLVVASSNAAQAYVQELAAAEANEKKAEREEEGEAAQAPGNAAAADPLVGAGGLGNAAAAAGPAGGELGEARAAAARRIGARAARGGGGGANVARNERIGRGGAGNAGAGDAADRAVAAIWRAGDPGNLQPFQVAALVAAEAAAVAIRQDPMFAVPRPVPVAARLPVVTLLAVWMTRLRLVIARIRGLQHPDGMLESSDVHYFDRGIIGPLFQEVLVNGFGAVAGATFTVFVLLLVLFGFQVLYVKVSLLYWPIFVTTSVSLLAKFSWLYFLFIAAYLPSQLIAVPYVVCTKALKAKIMNENYLVKRTLVDNKVGHASLYLFVCFCFCLFNFYMILACLLETPWCGSGCNCNCNWSIVIKIIFSCWRYRYPVPGTRYESGWNCFSELVCLLGADRDRINGCFHVFNAA
jgi:hypothetical protein